MKARILITLFMAATLAACSGIAFSPESAAMTAVDHSADPQAAVNLESIEIRQTVKVSDDMAVVVMTFDQVRNSLQAEKCLYTYEVEKRGFGWRPKGGGGGCSTLPSSADTLPDLEIGAGQSGSSNPGDPGFSEVHGFVNNADITEVRVTWNDDLADEVDVTNSTFVAYRIGMFEMKNVEGLSKDGDVLYTFEFQKPPFKER